VKPAVPSAQKSAAPRIRRPPADLSPANSTMPSEIAAIAASAYGVKAAPRNKADQTATIGGAAPRANG